MPGYTLYPSTENRYSVLRRLATCTVDSSQSPTCLVVSIPGRPDLSVSLPQETEGYLHSKYGQTGVLSYSTGHLEFMVFDLPLEVRNEIRTKVLAADGAQSSEGGTGQ